MPREEGARESRLSIRHFLPILYEAPAEADWTIGAGVAAKRIRRSGDFRSLEEMQIVARARESDTGAREYLSALVSESVDGAGVPLAGARRLGRVPGVTPYYEQDGITIYHGDCGDMLPAVDRVDLVLTDPPYGIGRDGKPVSHIGDTVTTRASRYRGWDQAPPTDDHIASSLLGAGDHAVLWGRIIFRRCVSRSPGWLRVG